MRNETVSSSTLHGWGSIEFAQARRSTRHWFTSLLLFAWSAVVATAAPTVTVTSPTRNVLAPGQSVNLSVSATGSGTVTYQWLRKGKAITGATSATLGIANTTSADSGWYLVDATDGSGTTRSAPIFVMVAPIFSQIRGWGSNSFGQIDVPEGLSGVVDLAAGSNHALALKSDGTVVGWGYSSSGQTTAPAGLVGVVAIAAGNLHSLALKSDGTVVAWGATGSSYTQTAVPPNLTNVVAVSTSPNHVLALKSDGTVAAWGYNFNGEIAVPAGLAGVVSVAAGTGYSLALKDDGTIVAWGSNQYDAASVPAGLSAVIAIKAGSYHSMALRSDGSVVGWGWNYSGQTVAPTGLTDVTAIAVGDYSSTALKADGTVVAWGSGVAPPADFVSVVGIVQGYAYTLALDNITNGIAPIITDQPAGSTVISGQNVSFSVINHGTAPKYQWRKNGVNLADGVGIAGATTATLSISKTQVADTGNYDVVISNHIGSAASNIAVLTVNPAPIVTDQSQLRQVVNPGEALNLSVTVTGTGALSYQWFHNGRPIVGATASSYAVASSNYADTGWYLAKITDHYSTLRSKAMFVTVAPAKTQIVTWGTGSTSLNLGGISDAVAVAAGAQMLVLKRDGSLDTIDGYFGGNPVPTISDFVAIAVDDIARVGFGLRSNGTVVAWSSGGWAPDGFTDVVKIAVDSQCLYALKADGTVIVWNTNATLAGGLTDIVDIGFAHAVKADGTVLPIFTYDSIPAPSGLSDVTTVDEGSRSSHALAIKNDGTVFAWGNNQYGQATVPDGLVNVVDVAAAYSFSLALKTDGSLVAWGNNESGRLNVPAYLDKVFAIAARANAFPLVLRDATTDTVPGLATQPASQTLLEAQTASFTVVASGPGPYSYQWRKNGVNVPGATSATLVLSDVTLADAGSYTVKVSNYIGFTVSNAAPLIVNAIPVVTNQSTVRQVLHPGDPLNLSVAATGTGTLSYQWIHNGKSISAGTDNNYSVAATSLQHSGWYVAVVTDSVGTRRSLPFFVTVAPTKSRIVDWNWGHYSGVAPLGVNDAISIAAGSPSLVLRSNGTITGPGGSPFPSFQGGYVAIASSDTHALALRSDGKVVTTGYQVVPATLKDVVAIFVGNSTSYALKSDGTVVGWLNNEAGTLLPTTELQNVVAATGANGRSFFLKDDGTVIARAHAANAAAPYVPAGLANVVAIVAKDYWVSALKADGTAQGWGDQPTFLDDTPPGLTGVSAISIAYWHELALKTDGTVVGWGQRVGDMPVGLDGVWAISAGQYHSYALKDISALPLPEIVTQPRDKAALAPETAVFTATVSGSGPFTYQWRRNGVNLTDGDRVSGANGATLTITSTQYGDAGNYDVLVTNSSGSTLSNAASLTVAGVSKIAAGRDFSLWLDSASQLRAVGANSEGQFGNGTTNSSSSPLSVTIPGLTIADIAAGAHYTLILTTTRELWATGANDAGQLGDGTTTSKSRPVKIATNVAGMAAGAVHSAFLKSDGSLWAMGGNSEGQLGDGTTTSRLTPVRLASGVVDFSVGVHQTLFVKSDGTLWGTGNLYNNGTFSSTPVQLATGVKTVAAGAYHSLFVKTDATLWSLGDNSFGQLGTGNTTTTTVPIQIASNVTLVAAGSFHSLFIKTDSSLWAMGRNDSGQLGEGTTINRHTPVQIAPYVTSISANEGDTLFMRYYGGLWATGFNGNYQLGTGTADAVNGPIRITDNFTTGPGVPSGATVTGGPGTEGLLLAWDPAADATSYEIWRSTDNSQYGAGRLAVNVRWPIYQDRTAAPDVTYYYWIRALNSDVTTYTIGGGASGSFTAPEFPFISTQPSSLIKTEGADATFSVSVVAAPAPAYQWKKNGADISGATNAILNLANVGLFDAGTYLVVATNSAGSATSDPATLTVYAAPVITTQPQSQSIPAGSSVMLNAAASGWPTPTFQWKKNGVDISGATASTFAIARVLVGDVGAYSVVASNTLGAATSHDATLTISTDGSIGSIPAGFDVAAYMSRYPDVAAVFGSNQFAVWLYYRNVGIYQGEVFDELFRAEEYLTLYPELFAIFGSDLGAALDHWLSTGRIEGKLGRIPLEFKAQGYFDRNPDVATAVGNDPILAWGHYWLYGIYEGRAYDDELRVFEYLAINADLTAAFVNDWRQAALHWMRYGRTEGRLGRLPLTFNVSEYLVRSPDVAAVWGTNPTTVFLHYWAYGIDEGRTYDDLFRPVEYLALNPDLAVALGTDRRLAFKHWVRYGQTEGRQGRNP